MDEKDVPVFYASSVQITVSPWDFSLNFGRRDGPSPKDVHPVGTVILSPQHALVIARILTRLVDEYQQTIGRIELPRELLNELKIKE